MPDYLAHVIAYDIPDDETRSGMGDALGALRDDATDPFTGPATVVFDLRGEAPDLPTAQRAARSHAAEVLDGWSHEVVIDLLG